MIKKLFKPRFLILLFKSFRILFKIKIKIIKKIFKLRLLILLFKSFRKVFYIKFLI